MNLSGDFLWLSSGRLISALIALLALRVSTHVLSPEEYGQLALLIGFQTFCGLLFINPIGQYINRHTHLWWAQRTFFARLKRYKYYVVGVGALGALFTTTWYGLFSVYPIKMVILASFVVFIMVISATWNATWVPSLNILGYRSDSVIWGTTTVFVALLSSWLITASYPSAIAWFCGQAIGMAVGAIGAGYMLRKKSPAQQACPVPLIGRKEIITYCLPLALATTFIWVQMSGYRFIMSHHWGLAKVGYAAVGLGLASQIWFLVESLSMQFFNPLFLKRISGADEAAGDMAFSDLLNTLVPLYLVLASATIVSADCLLFLLVDQQYSNVRSFVVLGTMIEFCRVMSNVLSSGAQIRREMKVLILPNFVGGFTTIVGVVGFGLFGFDILWAAVALAISGGFLLIAIALCIHMQVKYTVDKMRWGGGGLVLLTSLLAAWDIDAFNNTEHWIDSLSLLLAVAFLSCILLAVFMWRNPALMRLVSVRLGD